MCVATPPTQRGAQQTISPGIPNLDEKLHLSQLKRPQTRGPHRAADVCRISPSMRCVIPCVKDTAFPESPVATASAQASSQHPLGFYFLKRTELFPHQAFAPG